MMDEITQLRTRVREIENGRGRPLDDRDMGGNSLEGGDMRSIQRVGVICGNGHCGNVGHIARWCRIRGLNVTHFSMLGYRDGVFRSNSWLIGGCPRAVVKNTVVRKVRVVKVLVDTGNQVSIMPYSTTSELGLQVVESPRLRLKAANDMGVNNEGNVWVDIVLWGRVLKGVGLIITRTEGVYI